MQNIIKGPLKFDLLTEKRHMTFCFYPTASFKNVMKIFMKIFCLSFSFRNMQVDSFASVSVALIIVQRESALNSLYQTGCPKQPSRGVFRKMCSENTQQIYRRTPMLKCDLLNSHFDMGVFLWICCIFSEHLFLRTLLDGCFCCIPTLWNQYFILSESELNLIHNRCLFAKYVLFVFCLLHFTPSLHYFHRYVVSFI